MASLVPWISRKKVAASRIWNGPETTAAARSSTQRINSAPWSRSGCEVCASLQIQPADVSSGPNPGPSDLPWKISPWLMLPSAVVEGGHPDNSNYKLSMFYSLAEDRVIGLSKIRGGGGGEVPEDDAEVIGSSHGWIASYNRRNFDMFLSNPLSGGHVKLPPIHTLPIPECEMKAGYRLVNKLIISCSPMVEECRAMISFGPSEMLAFCCPGRSKKWISNGEPFLENGKGGIVPRRTVSFVYSSTSGLFFCVTLCGELEAWELGNPDFPVLVILDVSYPKDSRLAYPFLVVTSRDLYLVKRLFLSEHDNIRDVFCPSFKVFKFNAKEGRLDYMDRSLDGLAMFIGKNHSFAMRASDFPELKPNSIYYTDPFLLPEYAVGAGTNPPFRGQDIGIFNYEDKTFSPCYYPLDVKIMPTPMWFTPSSL